MVLQSLRCGALQSWTGLRMMNICRGARSVRFVAPPPIYSSSFRCGSATLDAGALAKFKSGHATQIAAAGTLLLALHY